MRRLFAVLSLTLCLAGCYLRGPTPGYEMQEPTHRYGMFMNDQALASSIVKVEPVDCGRSFPGDA